MKLHLPVFVRRESSGLYHVRLLGPPGLEASGKILESVKSKLAREVRRAAAKARAAELSRWTAPPARLLRVALRVALENAKGEKVHVSGRFSLLASEAPGALRGSVVTMPRLQGLAVHVPEGEDPAQLVERALARHAPEPELLRGAAIERGESLHLLDVELDAPAIVDRERKDDEAARLLAGVSGLRRKRQKDELRAAETLLEVSDELTAEARDGKLPRTHRREAETAELLEAATLGPVRAALLVGEPGVGKTAIVHELARRLAERQDALGVRHHRGALFSVSPGRLIAGMRYVGQWQERVQDLVEEAVELGAVLHAPSLLELMAVGRTSVRERTTATRLLEPHLASGELALVAEATPEALRRATEQDRSFVELFRRIRVEAPGAGDVLSIALERVRELEGRERVQVAAAALGTSLDLLRRFVPYEGFPGKAVRFLARLAEGAERPAGGARARLGPDDVIARFARSFSIAPELLLDRRALDLAAARRGLEERVRGQPEAVSSLVDVIATLKSGLKDPEKPLATLLFVGPTGVGKTESAKALAEALFGSKGRLVRFDLNEATDAGAAERLAGSAWAPEGTLTRAIRERPFSVVLLDEVEKASPEVLALLLQLLGEGRITDALGRTADARNVAFVLTSNLGAEREGRDLGFVPEEADARYRRAVEEFFRPELVNRLDRIVAFRPLGREALRAIAAREVRALMTREGVARRDLVIEAEEPLLDALVAEGTDPRYGARPLRRAVERRLAAPIAAALAARPGTRAALVSARRNESGDAAVTVEPIEGLGPIDPGPRPGEGAEARDPAELARELRERLDRLRRSRVPEAAQPAFEEARAELENALAPFEDESYTEVELGEETPEDPGRGRPRTRKLRVEWTPVRGGVPAGRLREAARRLARAERLAGAARLPLERVRLALGPLGGEVAARFARVLAAAFVSALEGEDATVVLDPQGMVVEARGARGWLSGEAGVHELRAPDARAPVLCLVAVDDAVPPLRVVRKYVPGGFVHDVSLGCSAPISPRDEPAFGRALGEILGARRG